ncbi:MAG: alpha-E domain-containing protein [Cyclobacteriaceae bacterium]
MLSRVANSVYWLGRYIERAENYARFIDVNFNLELDLPPNVDQQWKPLIVATGDKDLYDKYNKGYSRSQAIYFLAFDGHNSNSILNSITYARENARIVRENLSTETWEVLNELYYFIKDQKEKEVWKYEDPRECLIDIRKKIQLLNGLSYDTAPRTQGWYFTKLGQFIERADKTSRILDVKYHILLPSIEHVGSPLDFLGWSALLKSVSGYNSFRRVYGRTEATSVVEYLVLNRYFPRSILFCVMHVEECLREIEGTAGKLGFSNKIEKEIGILRSKLEFSEVSDVIDFGLHEYLDEIQKDLNSLSDQIAERYFTVQSNVVQSQQSQ